MSCPLCNSNLTKISPWNSRFFLCSNCYLHFLNPELQITWEKEKDRYLLHKNTIEDDGYVSFLNQLIHPCTQIITKESLVLDSGCGPNPVLTQIFESLGYHADCYDPYFFPDIKDQIYDLVILHEVVEHFKNPLDSLRQALRFVSVNGYLGIGTSLWQEGVISDKWSYMMDSTHISIFHKQTISALETLFPIKLIKQPNERTFIFQKLELTT